ncbi:hypothetical protein B0H11DRAFT_780645 [Mycena galericulata]|nr:hypothetical protein B0H11DRAFT_780645 [Mycena galericulata]
MTTKSSQLHPSLRDMKLGVWRVILEKDTTRFSLMAPWQKFKIAFPTIRKLTLDCFALAPVLFPLLCLQMMFTQVVPTIMWHLLNRIISIFGIGLTRGQFDSVAITNAVVARIAFAVVVAVISYGSRQMEDIVQHRIVNHFEAISFQWKSRADKSTIEDCVKDEDNLTTTMVWYAYRDVLLAAGRAISILAQLYYISTLASTNKEASLYIILLFVKPVTRHIFEPSLWGKSWVAEAIEPNFTRMHSLKSVGGKAEYKQEMNGSFAEYLVQEYRKARRLLGDTSASYPAAQYRGGFGLAILSELLGHLYLASILNCNHSRGQP